MLGKKVKCPKCTTIFEAKVETKTEEEEGGTYSFTPEPEPQPRSKALRRASGEDVDDDEEDEDEPVRKKRRSDDDDSDDEEEEEDDEEETEEQRRIKKRKAKKVKRSRALDKVWGPAIGMQITGVIGILSVLANVAFTVIGLTQVQARQNQQIPATAMGGILAVYGCVYQFAFFVQIAVLLAASRLKRLESFREATVLSILCFLPCTFCFVGLPVGIWALVVINSSDVRPHFKT